jgi:hypothetical protein
MRIISNENNQPFYDALTLLTLFIFISHLFAIRKEDGIKKGNIKK